VYVGGKSQVVRSVAGEQIPGRFVSELPNYHRLERHYDVYYHRLYVDLTPKQRRVYNSMLQDMFVWLDDNPMVAKLPLERRIRLREMALAYPSLLPNAKYDPKTDTLKDVVYFEDNAESAKIDSVKLWLEDHDEPTFLLTHSKKFATVAAKRLGAQLIIGDTSDKDRNEIKDGFIAREKGYKNVVATIPTIAEGMDGLQKVCRTAIFFSRQDSRILNEQVIGRFARRGQDEQVNIIDVVANDTFDTLNLEDQNEAGIEYLRSLRKEG
jgi:superfamily II DNA or RNA helicase